MCLWALMCTRFHLWNSIMHTPKQILESLTLNLVCTRAHALLSRRRSAETFGAETQCWVRIRTSVCPHSWCACATDLLTSNVHVAAPYCARQLKTQTRSCEISAREAKTARKGIRENDRLRSAKNADYTACSTIQAD